MSKPNQRKDDKGGTEEKTKRERERKAHTLNHIKHVIKNVQTDYDDDDNDDDKVKKIKNKNRGTTESRENNKTWRQQRVY